MQINVLGTEYKIKESNVIDDPALEKCDGYCDDTLKICVINSMTTNDVMDKGNLDAYKRKVLRHELIHAFLYESGLCENSWAANEEIIDWIASQFPKLKFAFEQAERLLERG